MLSKYYFAFIAILFMAFIDCRKEGIADDVIRNYLKINQVAIDLKDVKTTQSLLTESLIKNNAVVFASEYHAVALNNTLRLFLIKVLHQYTDTLCYFPEMSYATSQLMNHYIQTGDEPLLDFIYKNFKGSLEYTQENFSFWQQLRQYVQTLPPSKKLIVVGCDIEHQSTLAMRFFRLLLDAKTPPESIRSTVEALKTRNTYLSYRTQADIDWLQQQVNAVSANKLAFQELLGDKFFDFELVLTNMQTTVAYIKADGNLSLRENALWENFKILYPRMPQGKWFGQWGTYHTMQKASHTTLSNFIKNDAQSPTKNRVLTLHTMYENSHYMSLNTFKPVSFTNLKSNNPYTALSTMDLTLFRLNNTPSPFEKKLLWWDTEKSEGGVTTDYYQFVLFVRNAQASKPYN